MQTHPNEKQTRASQKGSSIVLGALMACCIQCYTIPCLMDGEKALEQGSVAQQIFTVLCCPTCCCVLPLFISIFSSANGLCMSNKEAIIAILDILAYFIKTASYASSGADSILPDDL